MLQKSKWIFHITLAQLQSNWYLLLKSIFCGYKDKIKFHMSFFDNQV